jgi:hypothetical protein
MLKNFKNVRRLAKNTEWEVDITKHDVVAKNTREATIKKMIIKKCSHYYEFEEIMKNMSIIISFFVMKFIKSDKENIEEENILLENYEAWIASNEIVSNDSTSADVSNEIISKKIVSKKNALNEIVSNDVDDVDVFDYASNDDNSEFSFENVIISQSDKISQFDKNRRFKNIVKKIRHLTNDKIKIKERKSLNKHHLDDSDIDVSKKFKRMKLISFVDFLIQVQFMKFKNFITQSKIDRALSQQRFETEMKQRNQHHEEMILRHQETILKQKKMITTLKMQHEKIMIRLKIELKKISHKWSFRMKWLISRIRSS